LLLGYSTAARICAVSEGVNKSGVSRPSAPFFADFEQRCPNLRRLHLSNANLKAPLPASVEFLALSESWLSPSGWPASRFDAESQTVTLPRLTEVELVGVKLRKGTMAALPASVERLKIRNTSLPENCFLRLSQSDPADQAVVSASRLAEIDLSDSSQLTSLDAYNITKAWPHVTTIKLNRCINAFSSPHVLHIHNNLDGVEVLEANDVWLCDRYIRRFCRKFRTLRRLSVAGSQLNTHRAWSIVEKLTKLESLDVSGCRQLHRVAFFLFAKLKPTLRFLDVSDTNVDSGTVDVLRLWMPDCEVVH